MLCKYAITQVMAIACDKLILPKLSSGSAVSAVEHKGTSRVDRETYLCFLLEPLLVAVDRVLAVRCT